MGLELPEWPRRPDAVRCAGDCPSPGARGFRAACAFDSLSRDDLQAVLALASALGYSSSLDACTELAVDHLQHHLRCEISPVGDGDPLGWLQHRLHNDRHNRLSDLICRGPRDDDGIHLRLRRLSETDVVTVIRQVDTVRTLAAAAIPSSSRRFGRHDQTILSAVQPLLAAASANALVRQELTVRRAVAESTGSDLLLIDKFGMLRRASPWSVEQLRRHFPHWRGTLERLPGSITALAGGNGEVKPLIMRGPDMRMVLQRVRRQSDGGALLLVQRQRTRLPTATLLRFGLSRREAQIVALVMRGRSNREIAQALGVSYHTVKTHLERILEKLGVHSRTEVAVAVLELAGAVAAIDPGADEPLG